MKPGLIFLTFLFSFYSGSIYADWSEAGVVNQLRIYDGAILGRLEGVELSNCGSTGNPSSNFKLAANVPMESYIFSILLTAQSTGKYVKVLYDDINTCDSNRLIITGARLIN